MKTAMKKLRLSPIKCVTSVPIFFSPPW